MNRPYGMSGEILGQTLYPPSHPYNWPVIGYVDDLDRVNQLLMIANNENLESETIKQARILEGSLRNTGIHTCWVIITPDDITNFVPKIPIRCIHGVGKKTEQIFRQV